jgi:phosphatidylinositol alpha-mannosyltransferase
MKVAMVCPYSLSVPGGVQGQVLGIARGLRSRGHAVTVLAPADDRPVGRSDAADGVWVVGRSVSLRSNGSSAPLALSPLAVIRTGRWLAHGRFDVVHLHEPLAPAINYAAIIGSSAPLVGTFHRAGDSGWYQMMRPVARWANRRLRARVAVSEEARDTALRAMGGTYEVLFNGVEIERFASATPTPTGRPTVLFLGRHEPRKGLDVLLEAFARVTGPATLWVAGDGPSTEALRRSHPAADRVVWLGRLDDAQVASRLAGAHILCAPSLRGESFGMVLVEAMAARTAVVASDIPGYRAASAGRAVLVAPGDVGALANALDEAIADALGGTRTASSESLDAGVARAAEISMDRLVDAYLEIYERVTVPSATPGGR